MVGISVTRGLESITHMHHLECQKAWLLKILFLFNE
jgi:hypothetical protein